MSALTQALLARFEPLEDVLNALDAKGGDGDHGSTIVRGLQAAAEDEENPVTAFRRAAGGASGSLFAQMLASLLEIEGGAPPDQMLARAYSRIQQIGQAKLGEKTMLDALAPAAGSATLAQAAQAAWEGAQATVVMTAKRGRAKHVEGGGAGHMDAGARSVAEMISVAHTELKGVER